LKKYTFVQFTSYRLLVNGRNYYLISCDGGFAASLLENPTLDHVHYLALGGRQARPHKTQPPHNGDTNTDAFESTAYNGDTQSSVRLNNSSRNLPAAALPSRRQQFHSPWALRKMGKRKNHTARNATYKAHRNGIKKPIKQAYIAQTGVREAAGGQRWLGELGGFACGLVVLVLGGACLPACPPTCLPALPLAAYCFSSCRSPFDTACWRLPTCRVVAVSLRAFTSSDLVTAALPSLLACARERVARVTAIPATTQPWSHLFRSHPCMHAPAAPLPSSTTTTTALPALPAQHAVCQAGSAASQDGGKRDRGGQVKGARAPVSVVAPPFRSVRKAAYT
jgi:hypothetical protein